MKTTNNICRNTMYYFKTMFLVFVLYLSNTDSVLILFPTSLSKLKMDKSEKLAILDFNQFLNCCIGRYLCIHQLVGIVTAV